MKRLVLLTALLLPATAAAQQPTPQPRTVTVMGNALVERAPDQALLVLAVESQAANARDAARANATRMERVVAALRQAGIGADKIRTVGYQLYPEYAPPPPEGRREEAPRIVGYRAVNSVQVTIDAIDRVGPTLDAAIEAGANRASSLEFRLRDPAEARAEALRMAVQKARAEAQAIVAAADEVLGPILTIHTDSYMPSPPPSPMYDRMAVSVQAAPTPIEQGTVNVTGHVTMVFQLGR